MGARPRPARTRGILLHDVVLILAIRLGGHGRRRRVAVVGAQRPPTDLSHGRRSLVGHGGGGPPAALGSEPRRCSLLAPRKRADGERRPPLRGCATTTWRDECGGGMSAAPAADARVLPRPRAEQFEVVQDRRSRKLPAPSLARPIAIPSRNQNLWCYSVRLWRMQVTRARSRQSDRGVPGPKQHAAAGVLAVGTTPGQLPSGCWPTPPHTPLHHRAQSATTPSPSHATCWSALFQKFNIAARLQEGIKPLSSSITGASRTRRGAGRSGAAPSRAGPPATGG